MQKYTKNNTFQNLTHIKENLLIDKFCNYVKVSSEIGNEKLMCDTLYQELEELGYSPKKFFVNGDYKTNGYNIYVYVKGNIPGTPFLLNAHIDTVSPGKNIKPVINEDVIRSDGSTILAADDKTGITAIMVLLETVKKNNLSHRSIEVLFTVGEEAGLKGIQSFSIDLIKSKFGYVLDSSNPVGGIIVSAPSSANINVIVHGKSAHAGRVPEKGVSAIQVASKALAHIPLLRIDEETTCNVGSFVSQYALNVVPDRAEVKINVRSLNEKKMQTQIEKIKAEFKNACESLNAQFDLDVSYSYKAYYKNQKDMSITFISSVMKKLNIKPYFIKACGGSDAHILNSNNIDVVNLGVGNENVHSLSEQIEIKQLVNLYELIFLASKTTDDVTN